MGRRRAGLIHQLANKVQKIKCRVDAMGSSAHLRGLAGGPELGVVAAAAKAGAAVDGGKRDHVRLGLGGLRGQNSGTKMCIK